MAEDIVTTVWSHGMSISTEGVVREYEDGVEIEVTPERACELVDGFRFAIGPRIFDEVVLSG